MSFIFQNLKVAGPLRGKFDFFSPLGYLKFKAILITEPQKFYSVRAFKWNLNDKNLIHG